MSMKKITIDDIRSNNWVFSCIFLAFGSYMDRSSDIK